jgi:hypothetical protein
MTRHSSPRSVGPRNGCVPLAQEPRGREKEEKTRISSSVRAIACKGRRHPRHSWHSRQCGFRNLQNPKGSRESESHSLRQILAFRFNNLQAALRFPVQRSSCSRCPSSENGAGDRQNSRFPNVSSACFCTTSRQRQVLGLSCHSHRSGCSADRRGALNTGGASCCCTFRRR